MRPSLLIIFVGIAVRLALVPLIDWQADLYSGDSRFYWQQAHDLSLGMRPPGYAFFLALVRLSWLVLALQSALTILTALAAYRVTRSLLAGCLIAACPFFVFFEWRVLSEILYGAMVLLAFFALYRSKSLASGAIAGILLGLAILTRDTLLLLPLFALLFLRSKQGLAMVAAAYLVAAPVFLSSGDSRFGLALWIGTWERNADWTADLQFPAYAFRSPQEKARLEAAFKSGVDAPFTAAAIDRIRSDPIGTAEAWAVRYPRLWLGTRSDLSTLRLHGWAWTGFKAALWGLNALLLAFGLAGLWMARNAPGMRLLAVPVAYVALVYVPFHNTETRYSLMALPFLLILASKLGGYEPMRPEPGQCRV